MPDLYDLEYPGEVAGHVEAGEFFDDMVTTTRGHDVMFDGNDVPEEGHAANPQSAGATAVNRAIGETVKRARERDKDREPTSDVAQEWRCGNVVLQDANAVRLINANGNRKSIVVSNQSSALVYAGRESGIRAAGPNVCYIPAGVGRTFTHTRDIWVVGIAGQVVDFVEENYQ